MVDFEDNKPIDKPSPRQSMTVEELIQVFQRLEEDVAAVRINMPTDQAVPESTPSISQNASPSASRSQTPSPPPGAPLPGPNDECCDHLKDFIILAMFVATYGAALIYCIINIF